jgi:hypothetical protein
MRAYHRLAQPAQRPHATKGLVRFDKCSPSHGNASFSPRGNIAAASADAMDEQVHTSISIVPGSLTAILEKQSGQGRSDRFLVIVDVETDAGRAVELVVAKPQGINPLIKLLRIKAGAPPAPGGARVRRTLRYEETPAAADYKQVWLGEGDAAISAKVSLVM